MAEYAHVVVGGGISGLSAAHYTTQRGVPTLLIEASERAGGCVRTQHFDALGGFWVEAGGHTCFNSYGNLLGIMEQLGLLHRTTAKEKQSYQLWVDGERRGVLSALHPFELAASLPRLFTAEKSGKSVSEYYARVLGRRNYRDLLGPAFRSVVCQEADDFPAEALFRKKPRRKDVLRAFTMPEGLAEIPQAIAAQAGLAHRFGSAVASVTDEGDGYRLRLDDGGEIACAHLTLAVPPDACARLLETAAPELAQHIRAIGTTGIDTLVLAFARERLAVPEIAGLISVDGPFLSAVSRDFLADPSYRGFAFHFPAGRLSEDERLAAACRALDADPAQAAAVAQVRNRLPALRKGHLDQVQAIDRALAGSRLAITGNWFLGVSMEDCATRSRSEHERLFGPLPGDTAGHSSR